ncbi:MAG: guanosine monophosphate reductase, partial [Proteobacteria bacterium]
MRYRALGFDDVSLIPGYNGIDSPQDVEVAMKDLTQKLSLALPIISSNMDTITGSKMANFLGGRGGMGALHRAMTIDLNVAEFKKVTFPVFVSVGCDDLARIEALRDAGADYFCMDLAHGHTRYLGNALKRAREMLPNACILAGNVATYDGASFLARNGADMIKVGVGSGSVSSTRTKTGFGVPPLTAIADCKRINRSIVADGGIRTSGDMVKALAFGADFCMVGGMFAGCESTPGQ